MSVERGFDPAMHVAAGRALTPLREEGVLILGSGMSFHNMRAYGDSHSTAGSHAFDAWLNQTMSLDGAARAQQLALWANAPSARFAHPPGKEEHLLPLMVVAGAAEGKGERIYAEEVLATAISAFRFN
jgi:aromatic ring-opening dioxygenase catalytic subunit (LigB family)